WREAVGDLAQIPVERVEGALISTRVVLQTFLQTAHDRRFRRTDGAMQQQHALLGAVALCRSLEEVDKPHQRDLETKDRIVLVKGHIPKEFVAYQTLFGIGKFLIAILH